MKTVSIDTEVTTEIPDDKQKDPAKMVVLREEEEYALKALEKLRYEYREVFVLHNFEGLSGKKVAKILKIPEGTVKTYLHRAKKELINLLTLKDF